MTITVNKIYEKGKHYEMSVLFAHSSTDKDPNAYVNVQETYGEGKPFRVEVEGKTAKPLKMLNGKKVDLVCTEVTEKGPEFALAEKYFVVPDKAKAIKGKNIGKKEGVTVELKSSLVYKAETGQVDTDQPFEIAKQIAAFMNTNGGDLFMGVNDDGYVVGIERDLPHLCAARLVMGEKTDAEWSYSANSDGYKRKLMNAVRFYIGDAAPALMDEIEELVDDETGLTYLKVHVRPSDEIMYLGRDESLVYRAGASVVFLRGRQRDQYVKTRFFLKGEKSAAEVVEAYKKQAVALEKTIQEKTAELEAAIVKGAENGADSVISVTGKKIKIAKDTALPLDKKFLDAKVKPTGLVYRIDDPTECRLLPAKTWQKLYEALLKICAEIDPLKFEKLPDSKELSPLRNGAKTKPNFARRNDRVRFKKASGYLGPKNDVRANLLGVTKDSFLDPQKLPRRVMKYFGVNPSDVRVWVG